MLWRRLYIRLAIATGLLFVVVGGALIRITTQTSELYSLETTQRINRDIALHAAEDMPLLADGQVNETALQELARHVMFINPIVEVYLLDRQGRILSHALPYGKVLRKRVDMAPLRAFLQDDAQLPIYGDDPCSLDGRKTFSVSPIVGAEGETIAYLYTVLQGKAYESIRQSLLESYNLRMGSVTIAAALGAALLGGLLVFFLLTRRLYRLSAAVTQYRKGNYRGQLDLPVPGRERDELDELSTAVVSMSRRIDRQFDAQQEIDRNRRELIANVSHDLRTGQLHPGLSRNRTGKRPVRRRATRVSGDGAQTVHPLKRTHRRAVRALDPGVRHGRTAVGAFPGDGAGAGYRARSRTGGAGAGHHPARRNHGQGH